MKKQIKNPTIIEEETIPSESVNIINAKPP